MTAFLEMRAVGRGYFDVLHDGAIICRSREPLLAGCRALLAVGRRPSEVVEIRHEGQPGYSLRSRVGFAAGVTVDESNGTVLARWKASPFSAVGSPVSGIAQPVPRQPPAPNNRSSAPPRVKRDGRRSRSRLGVYRRGRGYAVAASLKGTPLIWILPDGRHAGLWRVERRDGTLTDLLNLTRASDVALSMAVPP